MLKRVLISLQSIRATAVAPRLCDDLCDDTDESADNPGIPANSRTFNRHIFLGTCSASPTYVYPGESVFIYYAACIVDRFLCNVLSLFRVVKLSGDIL